MSDSRSPRLVRLHLIQRILLLCVALSIPSPALRPKRRVRGSRIPDWPRFLGKTFDGVAARRSSRILTGRPSPLFCGRSKSVKDTESGRSPVVATFNSTPVARVRRDGVERLRCIDLASGKVLWTQTQPFQYQDMFGYEGGPRSESHDRRRSCDYAGSHRPTDLSQR